jgi:dimethylargininase
VILLDELAIITRPGAQSRRPEIESMKEAVEPFRRVQTIEVPAVLDGGDVLRIGRRLYVGLSGRSNREAITQLRGILAPYGYTVEGVPLRGCLHLKSAVTQVAKDAVLMNPEWVSSQAFPDLRHIEVDPAEPHAANALLIADTVLFPAQYGRTAERLRQHGIAVRTVDVTELGKAEGGVTCCSVILEEQP